MSGEVSQVDPRTLLDQALEAHRAGRVREAIALYDRLLAAQPGLARAMQLKGAALFTAGQHEKGIALIRKAIEIEPDVADFHANLGYALREMGRRGEAVTAYRRTIDLDPESSATLAELATTLWQQGRIEPAVEACRRARPPPCAVTASAPRWPQHGRAWQSWPCRSTWRRAHRSCSGSCPKPSIRSSTSGC